MHPITLDDGHEFGLLADNAAEWDLPFDPQSPPAVERGVVEVSAGQWLSFIRWGSAEPEVVFLHGGGQNAHTWDTLMLALGRPAVAFDLPGHGHSYRRADKDYGPWANAEAIARALPAVAPHANSVVGMSLGGATTMRLAAETGDRFGRVVLVDVTPNINQPDREMTTMERGSVALIAGPPTYESFEAMADAAIALSPYRGADGVRRGVRHNSYQRPDGQWTWRYDLFGPRPEGHEGWADFATLWGDVERIPAPLMLVRGGLSKYVLDEDVDELRRRRPDARVEVVDGAGHAVQSDRPLVLAALLGEYL